MKKNGCAKTINRFLESDKYEALPLSVHVHCITCKSCRTLIRTFKAAETAAYTPMFEPAPQDAPIIVRIMENIAVVYGQTKEAPVRFISLRHWISAGCLLIGTILLFGLFSAADAKADMQILLYLCFAAFVTGYCAFFVGSNLNFFIQKLHTIHRN